MSEEINQLNAVFGDIGLSRGTMNGTPLSVVASFDGGYRVHAGQCEVLDHLRRYEKRKGTARSYREQFARLSRAGVTESRAKKRRIG